LAESFDLGTLIEEFREEARDQLDRVDAGLLELEREGSLDEDARRGLLRTLHTLKGNAGMLGLSPIRDFVHAVENVLKRETEVWPEPTVERLFEGLAALRSAVEAAGRDRQPEAFQELGGARHRLEALEAPDAAGLPRSRQAADEAEVPASGDLIRVPFAKLDSLLAEVGELLGDAEALERELRGRVSPPLASQLDAVSRRADVIRDAVMSLRLVPIGRVLGRFHGMVRRLARQQEKEARLVVQGEGTELDKSTADALGEPLLHLLRNAIDHGIGTPAEREAAGKPAHGTIWIRAAQSGDRVRIEVEDDGSGLDLEDVRKRAAEAGLLPPGTRLSEDELVQLIFRPGFSTRVDVSTISGQGVGLDVVARSVRELRGDLRVERPDGGGARFILRLPLTVAIVPSLVFEAAGELLALPTTYVARTVRLDATERVGSTEVVRSDGELHPLADPQRLFGWGGGDRGEFGVLIRRDGRSAVLAAHQLVEQRDLVVKAMPRYGEPNPLVSGASMLPGGRVILVLDPGAVLELNEDEGRGGERVALA
jgi:two-component system chemotaxis sensor kinase CheA